MLAAMIMDRRHELENVKRLMKAFPVTAILGPRQVGKTFLSKKISTDHYFDLENPRDLAAFDQPQLLLEKLTGTIVIDEVQRRPELFSLLRVLVDNFSKQKYLILGSASGTLLRQSSESLAGRIGYYYLSGFNLKDVGKAKMEKLWIRGGFPRSFLASNLSASQEWLDNYLTTFLEKDIPQLGITIPAQTLRRFWIMISHYHGQIVNFSEIGRSFGVSDMTIRKYMDILEGAFMLRVLQPWYNNIGKRVVKRPKIYLRDSGLYHRLLSIGQEKELLNHPKQGASWEGFALENMICFLCLKPQEAFFWSTHSGAEVDLFWQSKGKNWAVEFKYSDAPVLTKSMQSAVETLELSHLWVVYPGDKEYSITAKVTAVPLQNIKFSQDKVLLYH